ncbi:MAG TPA: MMPL family transporter [Opitutaceae bacterium]|nr:MMPL family transporter [Opitutaceae bacterium]
MSFRRRQITGWLVLALFALAGGTWLAQLDFRRKISTDVLDLIPPGGQSLELALVRTLASEAEARTMLLVVQSAPGRTLDSAATAEFAHVLGQDPAFAQVVRLDDPTWRDAIAREVFAQRLTLVFPRWLEERRTDYAAVAHPAMPFPKWLAKDTADRLNTFLATPGAIAFQDIIPADPLLLMPGIVEQLKPGLALAAPTNGGAGSRGLVWARLSASPLTEAGQGPAFAAIARAAAAVQRTHPGVTVNYTGVNRFAAASRAQIEQEVARLNVLSLIAVFAVAGLFVRRLHRALHLVPVVGLSVLGAWVFATLCFDRLQILVLVVGSLLTGVAIDYGFYLYMQPPVTADEDYGAKVRRLAKPLLASCFTTVAGFALLLFSDLPVIRQLGVFVGAGLLCALATAVVYFSTVRDPYLPARTFRGGRALPEWWRRRLRRALIVAWVVALGGLARLTWRDDIRQLEIPAPDIQRNDAAIRAEFGEREGRGVYLTYGDTLAGARDRLEQFDRWLAARHETHANLAPLVPTDATYRQAVAFARNERGFPAALRAALVHAGFEADAFQPFFAAYDRFTAQAQPTNLEATVAALQAHLTGPLTLLAHAQGAMKWFVTLSDGPAVEPPADLHTVGTNQLQTLNAVFARYRRSALWLSATGLGIVGLGVLLSYGWRDGLRIFAIPCGACLGVFGWFGWTGQPLNLFHLLGAFLGVCLTHNYSIFTATSAYRHEPPPVSVRLSALTTFASFGVLSLSGIPVVHALGETVAAMVLAALLVIELEHLRPLAGQAP